MKTIPGFADYAVTEDGKVWSYRSGKFLSLSLDSWGYPKVRLYGSTKQVHRLVALTYMGPSSLQVNHMDGVKTNNHLSNLEYVTDSQNKKHAVAMGLYDNALQHNFS